MCKVWCQALTLSFIAYKCVEDECSFASSRVEELVAHLEEVHGFAEFRIETKEFVSFEAFLTWKQRIEETTSTQFVRSHGPRPTTKGGKNHEMHCHRTERSSRCKTGEAFKCSCFIKVSLCLKSLLCLKFYFRHLTSRQRGSALLFGCVIKTRTDTNKY